MTPETFLENFGHFADAPNGVQKLKKLILQLAVQGKLVPQDPDEEPVSILLKTIKSERHKLVEDKIFSKTAALPIVSEDEYFFPIPQTWVWTRLGEFGDWGAGATPNRKNTAYYGGETQWFKSGELKDSYINQSAENITNLALKECSLRLNKPGDVLIAMYGATIGKIAILEVEATTNQAVCACTCLSGIFNKYLFMLLKAYRPIFTGQGAGGAQPNISKYKIVRTPAPLPPLKEQKRIVAKVNQFMALCDELEERQQRQKQGRVNLNNSALDVLLNAQDSDEFAEHWQRICDNFELLYDQPDTIGKLRSSILQLAVQGRLVPQDSNDEPVSVLLEKIKAEKENLIQSGEIKKQKPSLSLGPEEVSYTPAPGHSLVRLLDVCRVITDGDHQAPPKTTDGIPFLVIGNVRSGQLNFEDTRYVKEDYYEALGSQRVPQFGDILYTVVGSYGISVLVDTETAFCVQRHIAIMKLSKWIDKRFLKYSLESSSVFNQATACATGIAQKTVPLSGLRKIVISLPPLEEQKRIVTKVDQLVTLCDELEQKFIQAQAKSEKYAEAVVAEMTAA